jgi:DNA repair protein RadD
MATGTGKSMTMGKLTHEMIVGYPDLRILNCTHVIELVEGNYKELIGVWPFAPAGIYASSMGRRDRNAQILFGQLQTIWNKAEEIGHVDVMAIDEVQLVPSDGNTMYRKLIDALLSINPDMKIVGFTATPYRLDSGRLDEGDDKLFDKVVYTYGIRQGIDDGYLTPITAKPTDTKQDTTGVGTKMGDFAKGALQKAVDKEDLNRRILEEVLDVEGHRNKALFFCSGVEHATHMRDLIRESGRSSEVLSGKTPTGERRRLIEAFKRGDIWSLTNDNVMSTGTNVPGIDLIVDEAPTQSAGRYVQRAGRGTRVIYPRGFDPEASDATGRRAAIASGIKPNCRYMDFAGNIEAHGPVDMIDPKKPGKGQGEAPVKICPQCEEILHASLRVCWCCGHEFEFEEHSKLTATAQVGAILSTEKPWFAVNDQTFRLHPAKAEGKPPTVKCTYMVGLKAVNQWLCAGHTGYPKALADRFWKAHGGEAPFPKGAAEWLERAGELRATAEIQLDYGKNPKYPEIIGHRVADNDNVPMAANDDVPDWAREIGDEIPF